MTERPMERETAAKRGRESDTEGGRERKKKREKQSGD